jgi:hypothetical protein
MLWAQIIVYSIFVYLGFGVLFALWFVIFGITKLDDAARGTGFFLRLIIFFGAVPFWILLAWRLRQGEKRPTEINAHRKTIKNPE